MALPVSPAPKSDDVVILHWASITCRVAWTLLTEGVSVQPHVLNEARNHAIHHINANQNPTQAADLAEAYTVDFVRIARGKEPNDPWPSDRAMSLSMRWRPTLLRSATAVATTIFRKHYGDNRSLEALRETMNIDRLSLNAAIGGLREVLKRMAIADNLPFQSWDPERLDRILRRLAAYSPGPCPPIIDIVEGAHRQHVRGCPRCDRVVRMVRNGILTVEDLRPPSIGARNTKLLDLLVVQLHPDAVHHRELLLKEMEVAVAPMGEDLIYCRAEHLDEVWPVLQLASRVDAPNAKHLRGARIQCEGSWSQFGPLGPIHYKTRRKLKSRTWGIIESSGELPTPLSPPPSANTAWAAVVVLAAIFLIALSFTQNPTSISQQADVVTFAPGRGGVWIELDLNEEEHLTVVREVDGVLEVVVDGQSSADKASFATGDGLYRLHTGSSAVVVLAHTLPLEELSLSLQKAQAQRHPLQAFIGLVSTEEPTVDLHWYLNGTQNGLLEG